jgi:hypothetical protein
MADSTLPIGSAVDLTPPGEIYGTWLEQVHSWVVTVDHKKIGLMYIGYAVIFLLVGGFEAILLRIQLMVPHNNFLSPEVFNRIFTMHGTTMVFLMGMPLIIGFANYQFLDDCAGRLDAVLQLHRRRGPAGGGQRARRDMVGVCAAYGEGILSRAQHGLLGVVADRLWIRHRRCRS